MNPQPLSCFRSGTLKIEVHQDREALGQAAAALAAARLKALAAEAASVAVIFATGESQLATLRAIAALPGVPWGRVVGFHMDEYLGIAEDHPASFRHYLHENLSRHVPLQRFYPIEGQEELAAKTCRDYWALLASHQPRLCLLGIGENGHLAFNDPAEADFADPVDAKVVSLDSVCRQQQVNEGWFRSLSEVPSRAITLTIPALIRVPELILSIPGVRKAKIVKRTLNDPISTACPATILRRHSNATLFLDQDSASELSTHLG